MRTFFVTGGAGFMGSHFCRLALEENWCDRLVNLDALTYAGNLSNLKSVSSRKEYAFIHANLVDVDLQKILSELAPTAIFHFAAESHVDRSIEDPSLFLKTNILGTFNLLEGMRKAADPWAKQVRFVYVSTDEVYGSLGKFGSFSESSAISPTSPYAVSKASGDLLTHSYFSTFQFDTITVRSSNNYGPNQLPEKFIPKSILLALQNQPIPIYGAGENIRDWIFVEDFVRGLKLAFEKGRAGEVYNLGGASEISNLELAKRILSLLGKSESLIQFVDDRKGHDFRYSMDFQKAESELKWRPQVSLFEGLPLTVEWYKNNSAWWKSWPT